MATTPIHQIMEPTISVMLVEDHPEYREVIDLSLRSAPGIELTSEFGTAERALRSLEERTAQRRPDIILLDLNLPGLNGLGAIRFFKELIPKARIIILTQSNREEDVLRAISLGAAGYLLKSATVKQIIEGIRTVHSGGASLDTGVAKFILKTLKTKLPKGELKQALSEREMQVLSLLAEGFVKKQIADKLEISNSTVVTHVAHIYQKLHVQNAPAAIAKAYQLGLFSAQDES